MPREAFLADQDALDVACYRLLIAIEAALALCFHVSAKRRLGAPGRSEAGRGLTRYHGLLRRFQFGEMPNPPSSGISASSPGPFPFFIASLISSSK